MKVYLYPKVFIIFKNTRGFVERINVEKKSKINKKIILPRALSMSDEIFHNGRGISFFRIK